MVTLFCSSKPVNCRPILLLMNTVLMAKQFIICANIETAIQQCHSLNKQVQDSSRFDSGPTIRSLVTLEKGDFQSVCSKLKKPYSLEFPVTQSRKQKAEKLQLRKQMLCHANSQQGRAQEFPDSPVEWLVGGRPFLFFSFHFLDPDGLSIQLPTARMVFTNNNQVAPRYANDPRFHPGG